MSAVPSQEKVDFMNGRDGDMERVDLGLFWKTAFRNQLRGQFLGGAIQRKFGELTDRIKSTLRCFRISTRSLRDNDFGYEDFVRMARILPLLESRLLPGGCL